MICSRYGGMKGGVDYLTANKSAVVVRGDPVITKDIIDGLDFKQKFMSGCVAWHPDDKPTDAQKSEVMDAYERHFRRDQDVNFLWVEHSDKGRTELHFVIPEVELRAGKKFSPYVHKQDFDRFDALCEGMNFKHGWKSSQDLEQRVRASSETNHRLPAEVKDIRVALDEHMQQMFLKGRLPDRASVVHELENTFKLKVTRETKNGLSVEHGKNNIRLKGIFYERNYDSRTVTEDLRAEASRGRSERESEGRRFDAKAERSLASRISYDKKRYKPAEQKREPFEEVRVDLRRDRATVVIGERVPDVVLEADEDRDFTAGWMEMGRQAGRSARPNATDASIQNSRRPPATNQLNERLREITNHINRTTADKLARAKRVLREAHDRYRRFSESVHRAARWGVGREGEFRSAADRIRKLSQQLESAAGRIDDLIERVERRGLSM